METAMDRRETGNSLIAFPKDYVIIDLETTGLNPIYDEIIEVACLHVKDKEVVDSFQSLVRPYPLMDDMGTVEYFVDDFITELTGITNDMLFEAPTFKDISQKLLNFIGNHIIVGHNVNFDLKFLYDKFLYEANYKFKNDFVDTKRLSRHILPELDSYSLKSLAMYYKINIPHHRGMNDCQITKLVLDGLEKTAADKHIDIERLAKVIKHNNHPDLTKLQQTRPDIEIDPTNPFYRQYFVFTGKLERFTRVQAAQIVVNLGGFCENNVTLRTNYLVIGSLKSSPLVQGNKSGKMKKAEKLILDGQDLKILSEDTFYELLTEMN